MEENASKQWFEKEFRDLTVELHLDAPSDRIVTVENGNVCKLQGYKVTVHPSTEYDGYYAFDTSELSPAVMGNRLHEGLTKMCAKWGVDASQIHKNMHEVYIDETTIEQLHDRFKAKEREQQEVSDRTGYGALYGPFKASQEDFFAKLTDTTEEVHADRVKAERARRDTGLLGVKTR